MDGVTTTERCRLVPTTPTPYVPSVTFPRRGRGLCGYGNLGPCRREVNALSSRTPPRSHRQLQHAVEDHPALANTMAVSVVPGRPGRQGDRTAQHLCCQSPRASSPWRRCRPVGRHSWYCARRYAAGAGPCGLENRRQAAPELLQSKPLSARCRLHSRTIYREGADVMLRRKPWCCRSTCRWHWSSSATQRRSCSSH
jgi:hypothetical protein